MCLENATYGVADNSYNAAGGLAGLTKLVDLFYHYMDTLPEAKVIRAMHSQDLVLSKQKLAYFLSGWLGGPRLYSENFGGISIPSAHRHLPIGHAETDAWISCMEKAVAEQDYSEDFKVYLIQQLRVPAERIRVACGA